MHSFVATFASNVIKFHKKVTVIVLYCTLNYLVLASLYVIVY